MNKKKLGLLIMAIVLVGGLYYFTKERKHDGISQKNNIVEEKTEEIIEKEEMTVSEIEVDKEAPNFTLRNLDGEEVSLKDYRGKIVLINFWATWCKYCDLEMPDLHKLDMENEDLVVLAVDVKEDKNTVQEYIKKGGYSFPVLLDEKGEVAATYLVGAYPTSYFIDEDGILLGGVPGMMTYPQMNQILEKIRGRE